MSLSRRQFLTYVGMGSYALLTQISQGAKKVQFPVRRRKAPPPSFFNPIGPSKEDELILPEGYKQDLIIKWGEDLGSKSKDGKAEAFGFNNDFLAYFPIDALKGGDNNCEGLLWVNHEYPNPVLVSGYSDLTKKKTTEQIIKEKLCVGGSIIHVQRKDGKWTHVPGSKYTRRFTAAYPKIDLTGEAAKTVPFGIGTLANCSGGRTPWWTVLTCEENFDDYNDRKQHHMCWADDPDQKLELNQYGWIVEVDPFGELPPRKHSALGRFAHENAAIRVSPKSNRVVVYMGDDAKDQYLYKFVSAAPLSPKASRADQRKVLTEGTLYVADLKQCKWLALDYDQHKDTFENPKKKEHKALKSQADVLINARQASEMLGATKLDRPEDCEVHPLDGTLYVALTNNDSHGNYFGQILRIIEDEDLPESESFRFEIFLAGGPQTGLACPDNLLFDRRGNLWVVCDVSSSSMHKRPYDTFGNNGMFVVPTRGKSAGCAYQFASGPVGAELTGPWMTSNEDTLFLSVQHPGEGSTLDNLTSHWPDGGEEIPKPSVVAIRGKFA